VVGSSLKFILVLPRWAMPLLLWRTCSRVTNTPHYSASKHHLVNRSSTHLGLCPILGPQLPQLRLLADVCCCQLCVLLSHLEPQPAQLICLLADLLPQLRPLCLDSCQLRLGGLQDTNSRSGVRHAGWLYCTPGKVNVSTQGMHIPSTKYYSVPFIAAPMNGKQLASSVSNTWARQQPGNPVPGSPWPL
jgi:hypothetical protein